MAADAMLQRWMFTRNTVVEGLRRLLTKKLVVIADEEPAARAGGAAGPARPSRRELRLNFGISPSQARFVLSNFCMDEFGTDGQFLVDAVSLCNDVMSLQEVLNSVRSEIDERFPARMPALVACIREINETDDPSATGAHVQPGASAAKPATADQAPANPAPLRAPDIRPAPRVRKPTSAAGSGPHPMRLESAVSPAQPRFRPSDFFPDKFGVQGQELVDAVNRCSDVAGAPKVLNLIRTQLLTRHRDRLPLLLACVREINETAL